MRIDLELVSRKMFESRSKAQEAIKEGKIECNNKIIKKVSFDVKETDDLKIVGEIMPYVSRGGLKLEKAIQKFKINLTDKIMLDIGSSTGGFTDVALRNNVGKVIAIDVGKEQMNPKLIGNPKLELYEETDFRQMDIEIIKDADFASIDVSFISLEKITPRFRDLTNLKEIVCLIKPQFECGIDVAKKYKGIIKDKEVHEQIIKKIISMFNELDYYLIDITFSPIQGGDGNVEYLAYFAKKSDTEQLENLEIEIKALIREAHENFKSK